MGRKFCPITKKNVHQNHPPYGWMICAHTLRTQMCPLCNISCWYLYKDCILYRIVKKRYHEMLPMHLTCEVWSQSLFSYETSRKRANFQHVPQKFNAWKWRNRKVYFACKIADALLHVHYVAKNISLLLVSIPIWRQAFVVLQKKLKFPVRVVYKRIIFTRDTCFPETVLRRLCKIIWWTINEQNTRCFANLRSEAVGQPE